MTKRPRRTRKNYTMKPCLCPRCAYALETCFNAMQNVGPQPGDYTMCMSCALVMVFTDDMGVREATGEELAEMSTELKTEMLGIAMAISALAPDGLTKKTPDA
jgi:hypothetical protein